MSTRRSAFEGPSTRTGLEIDLLVLLYDVARDMRTHAD
jgi:MarR family transcriptional regulator for hemolysin